MRILLVASGYRPQIGGLQTAVESIAIKMQEAGHTVLVLTNRNPHRLSTKEVIAGINVLRFQFLYPRLSYLATGRFDLYFGGIVFFPVTMLRLLFLLFRFKPDVVNLHYVGSPSLFLWLSRFLYQFTWIVSLHGGDVDGEPFRNRFNLWLFRRVIRSADKVTACSSFLAKEAADLAPIVLAKCRVIPNGVDANLFSRTTPFDYKRPYLCGIGQLEPHKGFDLLITAFSHVKDEFPDLDLLIGGSGSQMEALADQISKNKLGSRVRLLGRLDQEAIASLMRGSRFIAIPSKREPFGIVALEARSAEKPIIASKVGGLTEALTGFPVRWVKPGDVPDLSNSIRAEMSAPIQESPSWRQSNTEFLDRCSWSKITEQYLSVYGFAK